MAQGTRGRGEACLVEHGGTFECSDPSRKLLQSALGNLFRNTLPGNLLGKTAPLDDLS